MNIDNLTKNLAIPQQLQEKLHDTNWRSLLIRLLGGLAVGGFLGACIYHLSELKGFWLFALAGAFLGGILSLFWKTLYTLWSRFQSEEWQVTQIEIQAAGQKWKLASSNAQKRIAWSLFVELTTRIATQAMPDSDGDNGIALKSLYDLFQFTRKSIIEIKPTSVLPSQRGSVDTVETYALAMLNQDLRPFLSKWHPLWDDWKNSNPATSGTNWIHHTEFRESLRAVQTKIRSRADGLGRIAGVDDIDRFFNHKVCSHASEQHD